MTRGFRWWGICGLGAGIPIAFAVPSRGGGTGSISVDILIWPVLVGALMVAGSREWGGIRRDLVARLLLAFLIVSALSLPIGIVLYHNLDGPRSFAYQFVIMLNFAAGYLVLRTLDDIDLLVRAFVASIGVLSIGLSLYLLSAGILGSVHSFHNSNFLMSTIYGWPNGFAIVVTVGMIMALYVTSTAQTRIVRVAYLVLAIGLGFSLVLTFSKTGWVAAAVGLWLLWLRFWKVRLQLLLVAGIVVVGVGLLFAANESFRMQVFTLGTLEVRLRFVAVVLTRLNPIILLAGSGSQSLDTLTRPFANVDLLNGILVGGLGPQDEFLNVLVKSGVLGLALFVAALVVVMLRTRRLTMSADSRVARLFRYWYAAAWAIVVSLFSVDELHYWPIGAAFWLMAGAMLHLLPRAEPVRESPRSAPMNDDARAGDAPAGRLSTNP